MNVWKSSKGKVCGLFIGEGYLRGIKLLNLFQREGTEKDV